MPNFSSADAQQKVDYVKDTLSDWREPWLLVFDNYDSSTDIKVFSPVGRENQQSAILFTSRLATTDRLGTDVKVEGLLDSEGVDLFLARCGYTSLSADELHCCMVTVQRLGNLALAIDQAAAYIAARKLSFAQFLQDYERRKEYILRHTPESPWEYRLLSSDENTAGLNSSVLTTWELSFDQLQEDPEEQYRLGVFLSQAAFFDHVNVNVKE